MTCPKRTEKRDGSAKCRRAFTLARHLQREKGREGITLFALSIDATLSEPPQRRPIAHVD